MPRACSTCQSEHLEAINRELAANTAIPALAALYRVSSDSLLRHKQNHLPKAVARAEAAKEATRGDDLLAQVRDLQARALTILDTAEGAGDLKVALAAIREARGCIELFGRLAGELSDGATVNVILSPEWTRLRAVIIGALALHPEARQAVTSGLLAIEAGTP